MDDLGLGEMSSLFRSLKRSLECAVCLELLTPETVICVNGHITCQRCKKEQTLCPICREAFSNVKQMPVLKEVLNVFPHTCRYNNCAYKVKGQDDHELYCFFKPTSCKECEWEGPGHKLYTHFISLHNKSWLDGNEYFTISDFNIQERIVSKTLHMCFGHLLWQVLEYNPDSSAMTYSFTLVFNGKPSDDIYVNIRLDSIRISYSVSLKLNIIPNVNSDEENCVYIPKSILNNFVNEQKKIPYTLSITKKKC